MSILFVYYERIKPQLNIIKSLKALQRSASCKKKRSLPLL